MDIQRLGRIHYVEPIFEAAPTKTMQGFTTRHEGVSRAPYNSLNLGTNTEDILPSVEGNRNLFTRTFGISIEQLLTVRQIHGDDILVIDEPNLDIAHLTTLEADAIITNQAGLMLGVTVADCTPILCYDPVHAVIAVIHAGWKGTSLNISAKVVHGLAAIFNTSPDKLQIAIGPCIGPCCYEVDAVVANAFSDQKSIWEQSSTPSTSGHWKLDLAAANTAQLLQAGVKSENIQNAAACVCCQKDLYFSYRRDDGETGRHLGFIMLKEAN